jgi:hypothetical protein
MGAGTSGGGGCFSGVPFTREATSASSAQSFDRTAMLPSCLSTAAGSNYLALALRHFRQTAAWCAPAPWRKIKNSCGWMAQNQREIGPPMKRESGSLPFALLFLTAHEPPRHAVLSRARDGGCSFLGAELTDTGPRDGDGRLAVRRDNRARRHQSEAEFTGGGHLAARPISNHARRRAPSIADGAAIIARQDADAIA